MDFFCLFVNNICFCKQKNLFLSLFKKEDYVLTFVHVSFKVVLITKHDNRVNSTPLA